MERLSSKDLPLVDSHLDLAENVTLFGRDVTASVAEIRREEAEAQALAQIELYKSWEQQGRVRIIGSVGDLDHHLRLWHEDRKPGLVLLMEGADPIVRVRDLPAWWRRGLSMIGLTFGGTKYGAGVAGGSPSFKQGGLTWDGLELLGRMADLGFVWDISHPAGTEMERCPSRSENTWGGTRGRTHRGSRGGAEHQLAEFSSGFIARNLVTALWL
jgi:microsomal dipeptidase-like Zn-dependent dipeptidase